MIKVESREGYAIVTMSRADKLNALNLQMRNEFISKLKQINADPKIRTVIVTGEGRAFCVGADVNEFAPDFAIDLRETFYPIIREIRFSDKIYIAAINGITAGACIGISLSTDFKFAKRDVKFVTAFQRLGLASDTGVAYFLLKLTRDQRAYEIAVLGGEFTAEEAERWGLLKVSENPLHDAEEMANRINNGPFQSYIAAKRMANLVLYNDLERFLEYESAIQGYLGKTEDFKEGISSFKEKREPKFKGI
ncbi:Enoyl-CoA hydratase/isomerase [Sulfolobus islandicus Y.G.57.14]|jgi:enoyl-CoA hydratase/carnithine racemase|uniref:Enoyl-CoA hydratase/isomerase n=4 Tax=Saccharolobus islandicus TaxID=43080 RepID=C3MMR9_SACI2|nr:enoyl-CoA hydratase-related protein [Sulfolobus islandicus]ACP36786.1 Enoyl-CoA hydratase/isomerase [Sulfolobus islandicus L.S.2.15]ACP47084.1 Enoyl-CoA hydratase/isomerase [Sulfolobus islandicus Y.G.57.14]ACP49939.1 Enoyl-CoA hydratase/isomerase [Sulfolobus islandicus Y.N.15.51]ADB88601.1 Enoyl-CoA hydratase/isomerase [Sulfolobus islandicus L.D.8.5]PVU77368.1 enoyl-CoA hydratase [Sulfolobus islandicus]